MNRSQIAYRDEPTVGLDPEELVTTTIFFLILPIDISYEGMGPRARDFRPRARAVFVVTRRFTINHGYKIVTSDGELFTWAQTKDEADKRCTYERVVFGRIFFVVPVTPTTRTVSVSSREILFPDYINPLE